MRSGSWSGTQDYRLLARGVNRQPEERLRRGGEKKTGGVADDDRRQVGDEDIEYGMDGVVDPCGECDHDARSHPDHGALPVGSLGEHAECVTTGETTTEQTRPAQRKSRGPTVCWPWPGAGPCRCRCSRRSPW